MNCVTGIVGGMSLRVYRAWQGTRSTVIRLPWLIACATLLCVSLALAERSGLSETLLSFVAQKYGMTAKQRLLDWQALVVASSAEPEAVKLERVNHFFNRVGFIPDSRHWGKEDYWATPVEFLASDGGDCEDFSIAKYFTLVELGVPVERLQITYVKALRLNQAHMVLTYAPKPGAEPLVLDNLVDEIRPASERADLEPVYSFNGIGLWLAKERGRGSLVGDATHIGLWRDLLRRMNIEIGQQ
ncbi:MAG: transglutaminase-like cysteine peptidase [Pseudomonadota bacterium]